MNPGALPILTYHAIDSSGAVTSTDPDWFAQTIDSLIEAGFQAVDLGDWINLGRPSVARSFAVAFDDGLGSILRVADRLTTLAIPATVFLLTDRVGLDNHWPGQPSGIPRAKLLDRDEIDCLARRGFRFGSHGLTHSRFDTLTVANLKHELTGSRDRIEQWLGCACPLLAYPYGASTGRVRGAASQVYQAAFGTRLAYATSTDDLWNIARIDAYYLRSPKALERLIAGRWQGPLAVRRALRVVRGTVASVGCR